MPSCILSCAVWHFIEVTTASSVLMASFEYTSVVQSTFSESIARLQHSVFDGLSRCDKSSRQQYVCLDDDLHLQAAILKTSEGQQWLKFVSPEALAFKTLKQQHSYPGSCSQDPWATGLHIQTPTLKTLKMQHTEALTSTWTATLTRE